MKRLFLVLCILVFCSAVYAQNRYALIIGNADYPGNIVKLPNAKNDTEAIYKVLKDELGYDAVLRNNLNQRAMIREIDAFLARLKSNRNSEGFLWYAGHAMEIGGENLLLPLDVDTDSESLIKSTSVSVNQFASQLSKTGNKVNVLVLDACRVPPSIGGDGRSAGDPSRLLKTVSIIEPDLFIIYSTASGREAKDGPRNGNSPFTQAFLKHIKSTEPLQLMMSHVTTETLSLTGQTQRPYTSGSMGSENAYYSLNPSGTRRDTTQDAKFFYDRGYQFYNNFDYETAIADFTEAIRLDPNYVDAYYLRGCVYQYKKDYDRAIADFNRAIRIDHNYSYAYVNRGDLYKNNGDYDRAIADYTQWIRIKPDEWYAYEYRGNAYFFKKDYDRAIADYTQLIRIEPNYIPGYQNRGDAYFKKNDYDRAIADYTQSIRIYPDSAWDYYKRGNVYFEKKDYDRAVADYEATLKIDPDFFEAREKLEEARKARGY